MKRVLFTLCALWVMVGCSPVTRTVQSPAMQSIQATQHAIGTQAALGAQAALATQTALETQQAMEQERADLQVTAAVLAIEWQKTQQVQEAELQRLQITAQYLDNQQSEQNAVITQLSNQATATAIVAESAERVSEQNRNEVLATLIPILLCVGGFAIIGVGTYGIFQFVQALADRRRYIESSLGPILLVAGGGMIGPQAPLLDLPSAEPQSERKPNPMAWVSSGGAVARSNRDADRYGMDDYDLVLNFLRAAIRAANPLDVQFPHYETMRWTSNPWQRAKGILENADLVYSIERKGTWVNEERYPNIGALFAAVHMKTVDLGL